MPIKASVFESLLLGAELTQDQRFLAQISSFYNPQRPQRTYSDEDFNQFINHLLAYCFPKLERSEALVKVGIISMVGFPRTVAGKIGMAALNVVSTARILELGAQLTSEMYFGGEVNLLQFSDSKFQLVHRNCPLLPHISLGIAYAYWQDKSEIGLDILPNSSPLRYNFNINHDVKSPK